MSTNIIWLVFGLFLYTGSCWYCYNLGWYNGNTKGINWARQQIYGEIVNGTDNHCFGSSCKEQD